MRKVMRTARALVFLGILAGGHLSAPFLHAGAADELVGSAVEGSHSDTCSQLHLEMHCVTCVVSHDLCPAGAHLTPWAPAVSIKPSTSVSCNHYRRFQFLPASAPRAPPLP